MSKRLKNIPILFTICMMFLTTSANSNIINNIKIVGNERVSSETISMFSNVDLKEKINEKN